MNPQSAPSYSPENGASGPVEPRPQGRARCRIRLQGRIQGVGYRPFVHALATGEGLAGWVRNGNEGVEIEVEGTRAGIERFLDRLAAEAPPHACVTSRECVWIEPVGEHGFEIRGSQSSGPPTATVPTDLATCPECLAEMRDPANRRHRYPFTNCTHCGPRFSMITAIPYDRRNTTMAAFVLCPACAAEYHDPANRRFHAQPNACPQCGPQLAWESMDGAETLAGEAALAAAVRLIRGGGIVAAKGLGGYHLLVDATNPEAVRRLRTRKHRGAKPFAVMVPSLDLAAAAAFLDAQEQTLLASAEAPIVLLVRRPGTENLICREVAPDGDLLGIILPYTPLHHLLMDELGRPVVATSGNRSEEPICIDEAGARVRLADIADGFLHHNRPIARPVDDSVAQVVCGRPQLLRRARGFAPLPVPLAGAAGGLLAAGGHLKNTIALGVGDAAVISPHIGDLENEETLRAFTAAIADLSDMHGQTCARVVCDLHPDYLSTRHARSLGLPVVAVQHHIAHVAACLSEHGVRGPALGVAWDGTGYGPDGTVWGGEWFCRDASGDFRRVARLRPFALPGGEQAVREPRRSALGVLHALGADRVRDPGEVCGVAPAFSGDEIRLITSMLDKSLRSPLTSSMGRLFDAVASLLGLCQRSEYEGQAGLRLEAAARNYPHAVQPYPFDVREVDGGLLEVDWGPMILALMRDASEPGRAAACFHLTLAEMVLQVALRTESTVVALTGGCFQNRLLSEWTANRLASHSLRVYLHELVPPNDGGLAYGQLAFAAGRKD
jgi:hydrogenase maturation protein HypF